MEKQTDINEIVRQIEKIRAEASQYKMVRVPWLLGKIEQVLCKAAPLVTEPASTVVPYIRRPVGLLRFLARRGLRSDPELTYMDAHLVFVPGCGMLVRKQGGLDLDQAREAAAEAGYIKGNFDSDINGLLDAIREELSGRMSYSFEDMDHVMLAENERAWDGDGRNEAHEEAVAEAEAATAGGFDDCPF